MSNYGVTDAGFVLKRLQDILTEQRARAVELFQDLTAPGDVVDTSDSSLLGRLINMDAFGDADLWEVAQMVYSAFDPNSATGIALDNLVQYGGISRQGASYSTAIGLFAGDNGTLLTAGQTVSSPITNSQFVTTESIALSPSQAVGISVQVLTVSNSTAYSITYAVGLTSTTITYTSDSSATSTEILNGLLAAVNADATLTATLNGTTLVIDRDDVFSSVNFSVTANLNITKIRKTGGLQASEIGDIEAEANTITTIVTPVLGWDSVTNPLAASPGRLAETDEELRLRFRNTKLDRSTNLLDSIYAALINIEGVEEVAIYENDTSITDSNGVLGHSFLPVVLGGSSQLIAEAIWENKPIGILSQGNTVVTIIDTQGFPHDIGFERPNPVTIYVTINLTTDPNIYPGDGDDQIRQAIIDYADENIGVGDDVIWSRLFTPINSIPGHQVDSMFIGTSPSPSGTSNIPIAFNAVASFTSANIQVNS